MIIEICCYMLKSGKCEEFVVFFEIENCKVLCDVGMKVFGLLCDLEDESKVYWMWVFVMLEDCDKIKDSFYLGIVWVNDIEFLVMLLIENYEVMLIEMIVWFENFDGLYLD